MILNLLSFWQKRSEIAQVCLVLYSEKDAITFALKITQLNVMMIKLKAGKWHHDGALGSCLLFNCYEISSFKLVLILDELIREDQWIFSRSIHAKSDFQVTFSIILDHFFQLFWIILYNLIDKPVF